MKIQLEAGAILIKGRGVTVSMAEHEGKTEVVVHDRASSVRLLKDKDGIHIGKRKPVK